jgi:AcrR family transcriptional regulator
MVTMAHRPDASSPRRRGRPFNPALDGAVLGAAVDLLRERGYQRLRVDDVATRAGVGLGALYRRWPTKRDLVIAALAAAAPDRDVPATSDPAADVVAGLLKMARGFAGPKSRILGGLLSELPDEPELADAVRGTLIAALRSQNRDRMRRLVGDHPDLDARADLGPAWVLFNGLVLGRAVSEAEVRRVVAILTEPTVARRGSTAGKKRPR